MSLELGVIGNCQVAALIDEQARMVWACLPRPDGDPVFSALLQRRAATRNGVFAIDMHRLARTEQSYLRNSAILETRLYDAHGGVLRIVDFAPRFRSRGRVFRPMMFVRIVEPLAGRPDVRAAAASHRGLRRTLRARHHAAAITSASRRRPALPRHHRRVAGGAVAENRPVVLEQPLHFIIGPDETLQESPRRWRASSSAPRSTYWQEWVRTLAVPADWQDAVIRAAITLKLCTYEDTGAVLAALTTSIPEAADSTRNWDYRYCWLRDSYFVDPDAQPPRRDAHHGGLSALHRPHHRLVDGDTLQPLYGITGDPRRRRRSRRRCRVIAAWARCASAIWPPNRCSTTCTAR